jgi:hypothetical protein
VNALELKMEELRMEREYFEREDFSVEGHKRALNLDVDRLDDEGRD